jgi:hypothetical protein
METSEKTETPRVPGEELSDAWFDAPASSMRMRAAAEARRLTSRPPPPPAIDDEVADGWFR